MSKVQSIKPTHLPHDVDKLREFAIGIIDDECWAEFKAEMVAHPRERAQSGDAAVPNKV